MNLFLASQIDEVMDKLLKFLGRDAAGVTLCFVSTAANHKNKRLEDMTEFQAIRQAGFQVVPLDIEGKTRVEIERITNVVDVIFVSGGNTFFLLQEVRRTGFDEVLRSFIRSGKPYVGSSAGSLILSPDIAYIAPVDQPELAPKLKSTAGLGLVPFSIIPHLGNPNYDALLETVRKQASGEVLGLNNSQAVVVKDDNCQVV